MDRPRKTLVVCTLGLFMVAPGCRSTRNEVPPARPIANDGRQRKPVEFSSDAHPMSGAATAVFQPNVTPNMKPGQSIGNGRDGGSSPFGAIPGPSYGGPGTSGLGQPPSPTMPATPPAASEPPASAPATTAAPDLEPPSLSQTIAPSLDAPGAMGRPSDLPSPN